jgi:hypothetical protein
MQARDLFSGRRGVALAPFVFCFAVALQAQTRTIQGGDGITLPAPPVAAVHPVSNDYNGMKV